MVRAQERMRRMGVLMGYAQDDPEAKARVAALLESLRSLGWEAGRNLQVDLRWAGADVAQINRLAFAMAYFHAEQIMKERD